jgi:hypothetical protein
MDVAQEALIKLEAHEKECLIRYENIQRQLDEHNVRFDKLDAAMNRQLIVIMTVIPLVIGVIEFIR